MELIKEWAGIVAIIVAPLTAFLAVKFKGESNAKCINEMKDTLIAVDMDIRDLDKDLRELEKREAANDARREEMYKMQDETRQDVKKILVSVTELATKVANNNIS